MMPKSDVEGVRYVAVRNSESETIPPFGVMQVEGVEADGDQLVFVVGKPDGSGKPIFFNSILPIAASSKGSGTADMPHPALFDDADGSPAAGNAYGPVSGSWKLKKNRGGFKALGVELSGIADTTVFDYQGSSQRGLIKGQLVGVLATDTTSHTIDNIEVLSGVDPRTDPESTSETVTVSNEFLRGAGEDNAEFIAAWDVTNEEWIFIVGKHEPVTVLTAWRVDTGTMKLQYKTRSIAVMVNGAESDWTDAHTGTDECE